MIRSEDHEHYHRTADAVLDSTVSETELREFESMLLGNPELKRDFAARLAERSAFTLWDYDQSRSSSADLQPKSSHNSRQRGMLLMSLALAVVLTTLFSVAWLNRDTSFAQIVETRNCEWGETSFPTLASQRISAGTLRLNRGLALLSFDHGATVSLEGPAVLEVVDAKTCRLLAGRAYSEISPGGEGFIIETPTAVFTDRGTVFGLHVAENGATLLSVFDGQVDVNHRNTGKQYSAYTNEVVRALDESMEKIRDVATDDTESPTELPNALAEEARTVSISTAVGRGSDVFVQPTHNRTTDFPAPPGTLLLKREPDHVWNRRIYLRFDLSLTNPEEVENAELQLYGVDTAMGYLSQVSDTTVSVFGLTSEAEDFWSADSVTWTSSPASIGGKVNVDPEKTTLLGQFTISPSRTTGLFTLNDSRLAEFLRRDTNGVMTLILTCGPISKARPGYVYGFASRSHPSEPAPALRLTLRDSDTTHVAAK
jgi:FecR protein